MHLSSQYNYTVPNIVVIWTVYTCIYVPALAMYIPPRKLTCALKRDYFSREYIFQPLIFRGHVSFQGSITFKNMYIYLCKSICTGSILAAQAGFRRIFHPGLHGWVYCSFAGALVRQIFGRIFSFPPIEGNDHLVGDFSVKSVSSSFKTSPNLGHNSYNYNTGYNSLH